MNGGELSLTILRDTGSRLIPRPRQPHVSALRPWSLAVLLVAAAVTRPTLASASPPVVSSERASCSTVQFWTAPVRWRFWPAA